MAEPDVREVEPATVIKKGEMCVITTLHRTVLGLQVQVKAHPALELFMRGLSDPSLAPIEVRVVDRFWQPVNDKPLLAYRLSAPLLKTFFDENGIPLFTLDKLSKPLLGGVEEEDRGDRDGPVRSSFAGGTPINLSYLRLVGNSEGAGVTFSVKGVYSLDGLRKLNDRIAKAQKQFYINYIRPVDLTVMVSTQELQL